MVTAVYLCLGEYLSIDSTGKITLKKSIHASLNMSALTLEVAARDDSSCCQPVGPAQSSTTTLTVQIIGVNTQPTFPDCHNYRPTVRENADIGTTVLQVPLVIDSYAYCIGWQYNYWIHRCCIRSFFTCCISSRLPTMHANIVPAVRKFCVILS